MTRCAVAALTWPAMLIMRNSPRSWLSLWNNWDANLLRDVAQHGYASPPPNQVAFFPGFPAVLALVHVLVREWTIAGLLISLVAGGVAVVALSRIAHLDYGPGLGPRAALYLVASPASIFMAAGYTESLFLALALTAWLAARRKRWARAALLAGMASFVRVEGLFLCAAITVAILLYGRDARIRGLLSFAPAIVPVAGYELYLYSRTGDWLAWFHAEKAGWGRQFTNPLDTFRATWAAAFGHEFPAPVSFTFQLEILAALALVVTLAALLIRRDWPEAVYVGLVAAAMLTSNWYESVPRELLVLWPLWGLLAALAVKRPWAGQLYLVLSVPVSMAIGLLFLTGQWAG